MKDLLDRFFQPKTIAVYGATDKPGKVGQAVIHNLASFGGQVFPVNPRYSKVNGLKCYKNTSKLPLVPDLAIVATPADTVVGLIADFGAKGIRCTLILSAGFKEAGPEGEQRFRDLRHAAKEHQVRIIGPNCMGLLTPWLSLNATFSPALPPAGRVAFISQSGAIGSAILDWAASKQVGFSYFASVGSMADIGFEELIDYFASDSRTACILVYMERLKDARRFMSAARSFARSKPIVILKPGDSLEGARAVMSHTGSHAGNDAAYDAAFKRAGVIRVQSVQQLFDCTQALASQPLPTGNRLAIVTNAGGPAILATDALIRGGGQMAKLSPETLEELRTKLSSTASIHNPVDVLADAGVEGFRTALRGCLYDPGVDAVLVVLTAQSVTDPAQVAQMVVAESKLVRTKPVYASWMGMNSVKMGREVLETGKIPWFPFPERAVDLFIRMASYRQNLEMLYETPEDLPIEFPGIRREDARAIIAEAQQNGITNLNEFQSKQLLSCYGIPVNASRFAATEEEAVQHARDIGFPVVLKIESPDIWHKSDVGGVVLNILDEKQLRQQYPLLMETVKRQRPDARLTGVLIDNMMKVEQEVLIGSVKDPTFGPVIVFGMGGTAAEIWRDRTIGLPPLNRALARHLVQGAQVYKLLRGFRNLPPAPVEQLEEVLCRFAYLLMDCPDIREVDINPFAMNAQGGVALDAAITLERRPSLQRDRCAHLCILPYPSQWMREVQLRNGQQVLLRPIRPEDEVMEAEMVRETSRDSLYFRFFGAAPGINHQFLSRMTNIDYDREMALVGEIKQEGRTKIIGVVRIVGDGWRDTAEYAILVADQWHGQGLGGLLTDFIIEIAREQGYRAITASYLKSNGNMRRLFVRKHFQPAGSDEDANFVELIL
jgi:acetyltransferase